MKLAFYFHTLFTLWSCTVMMTRSEPCVSYFYQIFLFDLVFMLRSPHPDSHTICKCRSVGTVSSNRVLPVCACITYEKELLYLHCSEAQIENITYKSNCSIIRLYRENYTFKRPNCLKLHHQPLEGAILIAPYNSVGWLG